MVSAKTSAIEASATPDECREMAKGPAPAPEAARSQAQAPGGAVKRSPLRRKKPMRRAPPRRRTRPSPERDDGYMERVRRLPCRVWVNRTSILSLEWCEWRMEAHHAGRKPGLAVKASDYTCIPLCRRHHAQLEERRGVFLGWTKVMVRQWSDAQIAAVQALLGYQPK